MKEEANYRDAAATKIVDIMTYRQGYVVGLEYGSHCPGRWIRASCRLLVSRHLLLQELYINI